MDPSSAPYFDSLKNVGAIQNRCVFFPMTMAEYLHISTITSSRSRGLQLEAHGHQDLLPHLFDSGFPGGVSIQMQLFTRLQLEDSAPERWGGRSVAWFLEAFWVDNNHNRERLGESLANFARKKPGGFDMI